MLIEWKALWIEQSCSDVKSSVVCKGKIQENVTFASLALFDALRWMLFMLSNYGISPYKVEMKLSGWED